MESHWDPAIVNPDNTHGGRTGKAVDGYFTLDANVRINKLFGTKLFSNLRLSNVLNANFMYPNTYDTKFLDLGIKGAGRFAIFTFGYTF